MAYDIGPRVGVNGEREFENAIKAMNSVMKNLKSEMDASVKSMAKMDSAEENTAKKADVLARSIEAGKDKIKLLQDQYDRAREKLDNLGKALDDAKRDFGENSNEALKAENAYNKQAKAVNDLGTQLNKAKADVNKMTSEMNDLENETKDSSTWVGKLKDKLVDLSGAEKKAGDQGTKLGTIFKGAFFANIATQALSKLTTAMKNVASSIIEVTAEHNATMASYHQIVGDYATEADAALQQLSRDTGLYASILRGDFTQNIARFKGLGYEVADATTLAAQATRMAADAAAFNDLTYEEAADSLASFINGQYRAGQSIKIFANDAEIAGYAVRTGLIATTKEWSKLSEAQKQATRLSYAEDFYAQSGMLGQSLRESGEWLIVTQNLRAAWNELLATIGGPILQAITPALQTATEKLTDLVENVDWDKFEKNFGNTMDTLIGGLEWLINNGDQAALAIMGIATAINPVVGGVAIIATSIASFNTALNNGQDSIADWQTALLDVFVPSWRAAADSAEDGRHQIELMTDTSKQNLRELEGVVEESASGWHKGTHDMIIASQETSAAMGEAFSAAGETVKEAFEGIKGTGKAMADNLKETARIIGDDFTNAKDRIAGAADNMMTKFGELAANAKAKAAEIAQQFAALPGQMLQIGADIVSGLWQGIKTRSQWLIQQIKTFCQSVVNGIKDFFKIASPSKVMRDVIGVQLMRGLANGIKLGGPEVTKAMKRVGVSVLDVAETILETAAKKEAELTEAMKAEGIDAARKEALQTQLNNVQNFSKEFTAALDAVEKKQESLTEKLRSYGKLFDTVAQKAGSALGEYGGINGVTSEIKTLERYGELLEQIKTLGVSDVFMADFLATDIDSAIEYAEKLLQLPDAKREEYLALESQRREMQKIVDETRAAEKSQAVALSDINEQVKALEQYDSILEELKRRGTPAELMNEIAGMSVEDATTYGQLLLDMSGKDFDEYIASWEKKQKTAAKIAEKFYQGELDALVEDFAAKIPAEMDGMVDDMYQVGVAAGKGLVAGLESERSAIIDVARAIARDARTALQTQEGIHSPATKWAELGGYMAQGVAVGFTKMMQTVSPGIMQSVAGVRTSDIERVGSGIVNGLNAGNSGGRISIEVPLVINGREFARAVLSDFRSVENASPAVSYG